MEQPGTSTPLHEQVTDVELQRHPANSRGRRRPGTFSHSCILTVSGAGVYAYQGYGPRGYTLKQHMQENEESYPMSPLQADVWLQRFEQLHQYVGATSYLSIVIESGHLRLFDCS